MSDIKSIKINCSRLPQRFDKIMIVCGEKGEWTGRTRIGKMTHDGGGKGDTVTSRRASAQLVNKN